MRRAVVARGGFRPPRCSAEDRAPTNDAEPRESAERTPRTKTAVPSEPNSNTSGKTTKPPRKKKGSTSARPLEEPPKPTPTFLRGVAGPAVLGGHFSANRRLMEQAKGLRRDPGVAGGGRTWNQSQGTPGTSDSQPPQDHEERRAPSHRQPSSSSASGDGTAERGWTREPVAAASLNPGSSSSAADEGGQPSPASSTPSHAMDSLKRPHHALETDADGEREAVYRRREGSSAAPPTAGTDLLAAPADRGGTLRGSLFLTAFGQLQPPPLASSQRTSDGSSSVAGPQQHGGEVAGGGVESEASLAVTGLPEGPQALVLLHSDEEDDEALAREVQEDLRLSEDFPFTPHRLTGGGGGGGGSEAGSAPASQSAYHRPLDGSAPQRPSSSSLEPPPPSEFPILYPRPLEPAVAAVDGNGVASLAQPPAPHCDAAPAATTVVAPALYSDSAPPRHPSPSPPPSRASPAPSLLCDGDRSTSAGGWQRRTVFTFASPTTPTPTPTTATATAPPTAPPPSEPSSVPTTMTAAPLPLFPLSTGGSVQRRTRFVFTAAAPVAAVPQSDPRSLQQEEFPDAGEEAVCGVETPSSPPPLGSPRPQQDLSSPPPPPPPLNASVPLCAPAPPSLSHVDTQWYDLPPMVQLLFSVRRGVTKLYEWQHNLLSRRDVRDGGNFVYSMPTSGGKTLVAEISLLRCLLNRGQSSLFVLPFVSLAEEKTSALQPFGEALGFAVEGHYGSTGRFPLPSRPALFVCTIEKANSLLNHLLEEGRGDELGAVVVDELHMVGEPRRGATLELFLSKLMLLSVQQRKTMAEAEADPSGGGRRGMDGEGAVAVAAPTSLVALPPSLRRPVQVIGMSATIPNLDAIAKWLNAALYEGTERPVPLRQYSVVDGLVLRDGEANCRNLHGKTDVDHLFELAYEEPDASVLIFCASRQQCLDTAKGLVLYAQRMATVNSPGLELLTVAEQYQAAQEGGGSTMRPNATSAVRVLVDELRALGSYSEAVLLADLVQHGVAFHHGGLLAEEREIIEDAYRNRLIRILCCTSTLAAGVNLPARRVIFKTPYIGREFLTKSRYLQMCGRAGRSGLDAYGESFLVLSHRDRNRGHHLMRQDIEPCLSQMLEEASQLPRALLECVAVGLVSSRTALTAWGDQLLASTTLGPIADAFEAPLLECFGPRYDETPPPDDPQGRANDGSLGGEGSSVGSPPPPSPGADWPGAAGPCLLPSSLDDSNGVGGGGKGGGSRALRRAEYVKALQRTKAPREVLLPLLEHCLTVLADSGLVVHETAAVSPPVPLCDGEGTAAEVFSCHVRATPFGLSAVRSCFSVEEALLVREELANLRLTGLILGDDLHLCYFLTPLREVGDCDWQTYTYLYAHLTDSQQRIANLLGVSERFITMRAMGLGGGRGAHEVPTTAEGRKDFFTCRRFYVALMLADVLSELPMEEVEAKYNVRRGQLQSLMRSASAFSYSITSFCHAMEWYSLEAVLASFVKRLGFGVKPDLVPLMEIRGVQPGRARALWTAGYKSPQLIAACEDPHEMVQRVRTANASDCKAAKFFSFRSAVALIRAANQLLEYQITQKKDELHLLTRGRM